MWIVILMPPEANIWNGIFENILVAFMTAVLVEEVSILILLLLSALSATEMSSHARRLLFWQVLRPVENRKKFSSRTSDTGQVVWHDQRNKIL